MMQKHFFALPDAFPMPFPADPSQVALYAVFGNPIAHSQSPAIHAAFARQSGQAMRYEARLAPLEPGGFEAAIRAFAREGGQGANITVPFKERAFALCGKRTARAEAAGAANTLAFSEGGILGDNTDGAGLVRDLEHNLKRPLAGQRVLVLGAGGAARGIAGPILAAGPACLAIANRTPQKARDLAESLAGAAPCPVSGTGFGGIEGAFDIVLNATAASLAGEAPPLPAGTYAPKALAYDLMYGKVPTPFLIAARAAGAQTADGYGMLVEQAAEAFFLWRGIRPGTRPLLDAPR
jgi:shikimate dehydrogenase